MYGDGKDKLPLLPADAPGDENRVTRGGLLKEESIAQIIAELKNKGIIPNYKNNQNSVEKQNKLISNAKEEFCFYYIRYKESLKRLFDLVVDNNSAPSDNKQPLISAQLEVTRSLNRKLNDLIQIMIGITKEITNSSRFIQSEVNTLQSDLEKQQQYLMNQKKIIASDEAVTKLNKEMVKYTEEKARYTNNLLNVYSVLNVVTLGLLVYVFRSTTD
jgi:hypothetical protein